MRRSNLRSSKSPDRGASRKKTGSRPTNRRLDPMANPMTNLTIGVDLGDRYSELYVVDAAGACVETGRIRTAVAGLEQWFGGRPPARVVLEAGTHSPWASRVLPQLGHEVLVANPRKLRALYENDSKDDRVDAEYLARVGRLDPALLKPITHRGEAAQADLAVLSSRDVLVRTRTLLINHTRGVVKAMGGRLPRPAAAAQPVGRAGPAAPDHEGGPSVLAPAGGAGGALHPRHAWAGLRLAAARRTDRGARGQECEEAGRDCRSPEAGGAVARSLDQGGGVRAAAAAPGAGAGELRSQWARRECL